MSGRHVPHVTAELPDGWSSVEAAELFGPGGLQIRVTAQPVAPEMDTASLATRHGTMLAEQVDSYRDHGVEGIVAFGGHEALSRRTGFGGDTGPARGLAAYLVHSGSAYIASATGPADEFAAREREVLAILEDLLILGRPVAPVGLDEVDDQGPATAAGSVRPPLPIPAWGAARDGWATRSSDRSPTGPALVLSAEELLVLASVRGCGTFPGVDPMILGALPRAEREAVARAGVRSLVTRQVVIEVDGRLRPAPEWEDLVDIALYPDLHVEVTVARGDGGIDRTALCVRPDALVVTGPQGRFGCRVEPGRAQDLVQLILGRSGLGAVTAGLGVRRRRPVDELSATVTVRTTWRDGGSLVGGELRWAIDIDGGLGAVDDAPDPGATSFVVRPTDLDGARAEILGYLPGG